METLTIKAAEEDAGQRLDKTLATRAPAISRARFQALIESGCVMLDEKPLQDCSRKVKAGEIYAVTIPPAIEALPEAQEIALDIVYEDDDLLVINKSANIVVHPGAGNHDGTIVNALLAHCGDSLSGIGGVKRPGIVHRLDKETSGLLVVAKHDAAHRGLSEQLSSRTLKRVYHAIVWGNVAPRSGRIETRIGRSTANRQKMVVMTKGGRDATTEYTTLENFGMTASLVECRLQTGRTHQIRVHMAHIRHWIVGDPTYGCRTPRQFVKSETPIGKALTAFPRQALHAAQLEFIHPIGKNKVSLKAPLPKDMQGLLDKLRKMT